MRLRHFSKKMMEVIQNNSQECGANLPENTSKWRTWDNDFIEIEEVNTLRALVNARSEDPPHSFRSNGRGRIKLDLGECTLPILKANTYQLPSLSTVLLRQKSPNTGKYCKVIGRGRGRHTQMSQMELGHNVEKEIDKQRSRASCHSNDEPKVFVAEFIIQYFHIVSLPNSASTFSGWIS